MSSGRYHYFVAFLLAATWSSSVFCMNAAASHSAHSLNLTNAIAQSYSSGNGSSGNNYNQNSGSQDLLPPSLGGGAKVQPTVTPPAASGDSGSGHVRGNGGVNGYGQGTNGMNSGGGGHHHHHGQNGGMGYSSNGGGGQGGFHGHGRWNNSGSSNSSQSSNGPVITIWNSPSSPAANAKSVGHSEAPALHSSVVSSSIPSTASTSTPHELQAAVDQTHEMEQKFAQEASEQIQQIHARSASRRRDLSAQISANNQNNSMNHGPHGGSRGGGGGNRHNSNNNSNISNDYLQKELSQESSFEQKQVESIQKQYEAKERAIHDAAEHLAAHYETSGNSSVPRLSATKNDLHVQNYEINDTASGAEVPLVATPKSLH